MNLENNNKNFFMETIINKKDRGFHWSSKAYYAQSANCKNEIMFGIYPEDGEQGTQGEMAMRWIDLGQYGIAPQLQVFNDSWKVLSTFADLLKELAKVDDKHISEQEFVNILLKCGFRDLTKYKNPYPTKRNKQSTVRKVKI